ncbi:MAG TPA: hypothetical protein VFS23_35025 [Vicinamibacterales bacterium]|nr:hypothetical protein [Vicinamibacterales bacterium]
MRRTLGHAGRLVLAIALIVSVVAASACRPSGPLRVTTLQTGRSLNSDKSVGNHTTRFKPDDTMFVSVLTDGPGAGTITARWRYAGRLVSEEAREVSYRDHAATEFHIQNSSGFPPGEYSVEIEVDGKPFATRTLRVDK